MGSSDGLQRHPSEKAEKTVITRQLNLRLIAAAIRKAIECYSTFFSKPIDNICYDTLAAEYADVFDEAVAYSLLEAGGIGEKDHLNLWCIGKVLQPSQYIESGIYTGSSLHALLKSGTIEDIVGIDPNLNNLKINPADLADATLISDKDFSEIDFQQVASPHLVYFDDHINAAKRIIEAHQKGFKVLLFDDATGVEGVCQRLYPAIPTIPMISNYELLSVGDIISWSFPMHRRVTLKSRLKQLVTGKSLGSWTRVDLEISEDFINLCEEANKLIKKVEKLPDLGDYIHQQWPHSSVDTSKFLIQLKD